MPRRTMTVTEIWAHPKGNRKDRLNLSELPDGDLLHLFRSFAAEVTPEQLLNRSNESCAAVEEVQPKGRSVTLSVEVGRYGEKGRLIDTTTMQPKGEFGPRDSVQVVTHGVLAIPPNTTSGILFVERSNNQSGVLRVLQLFKDRFHVAYPEIRLETEALVESEAWLRYAQLTKVSAFRRTKDHDKVNNMAVAQQPAFAGELAHTLLPGRGATALPRWIFDRLTNNTLSVGELLNFADDDDESEAEVTLEHNGKSKTFIIGRERRPSISYGLSGHNEDAWTPQEVRGFVFKEEIAPDLFKRIGIDWSTSYTVGDWSSKQLEAKMVNSSDQQG